MLAEIIISIFIIWLIIYLWMMYLKWGDSYNNAYQMYQYLPELVNDNDKYVLDNWSWALPPEVLSDSYKYVYFWMNYYYMLAMVKI